MTSQDVLAIVPKLTRSGELIVLLKGSRISFGLDLFLILVQLQLSNSVSTYRLRSNCLELVTLKEGEMEDVRARIGPVPNITGLKTSLMVNNHSVSAIEGIEHERRLDIRVGTFRVLVSRDIPFLYQGLALEHSILDLLHHIPPIFPPHQHNSPSSPIHSFPFLSRRYKNHSFVKCCDFYQLRGLLWPLEVVEFGCVVSILGIVRTNSNRKQVDGLARYGQ